ncbi:MAG: chloride channel protein [Chitinophagaceae bacterium]|jgi:H+/Cl- antiporter ClcA|nr:chloride channel protein [Chitinophagaceae bacterium]
MGTKENFFYWIKKIIAFIYNDKVRIGFQQAVPFWIASVITGLIAVFYTFLFGRAEELLAWVTEKDHAWLFIITPIGFILAYLLVAKWAPFAQGSGIPQVVASIELATPDNTSKIDRLLGIRIIIVKILSSLLMVLSGGVIGREGPTIQIAGSVFKKINQWIPESWPKISKKNMIMTGGAAGLAAAFNTPLGGIVFAVEELTKTHISYFKTALFSAVIIAGLTAQAILGPYLYLGYPNLRDLDSTIFLSVGLVAIVCGMSGAILSKLILAILKWKSQFKKEFQFILFAFFAGLLMASLAYFINPAILGSGKEQMTTLLFTENKKVEWYMPFLRILGALVSFTSGAAGGIFAPALSIGATIGGGLANLLELSATNTNLLVLGGMVGFLTGVTRSPFTSAILVLEMTDRHSVIFYLMLSAMLAGPAAFLIDRRSLYTHLKNRYLKLLDSTP